MSKKVFQTPSPLATRLFSDAVKACTALTFKETDGKVVVDERSAGTVFGMGGGKRIGELNFDIEKPHLTFLCDLDFVEADGLLSLDYNSLYANTIIIAKTYMQQKPVGYKGIDTLKRKVVVGVKGDLLIATFYINHSE